MVKQDMIYDELPLNFGAEIPDYCNSIPKEEWAKRIELEKSLCVIDEKYFFHRGSLIIPIIDYPDDLVFDVWTSISQENFEKRMDLWHDPLRINQSPYFGWLNTFIPGYGNTLNLKTMAQERDVDLIPLIQMIDDSSQLTIDQQNGITIDKVLDIVSIILEH